MTKIKQLIFLLIMVSSTISAQTADNQPNNEASNTWKTLANTDYSIQYPDTWELNESGLMGMSFVFLSPLQSKTDQFRENVNLLIQDISAYQLDLDQYVELSEGQIKTLITEGKIIESTRVENNGFFHQKVIYTGKQGIFDLKFEQYYWVENDKAYILTLTCEENQFDEYKIIGEKILNHFSLAKE